MKKRVVVIKIDQYRFDILEEKIKEALNKYFPLEELFSLQDKILLKPNLLMISPPDEAIITHPVFVQAVGKIFQEKGFKVCIGDSPGGFNNDKEVNCVYEECGFKDMVEKCGFELLYPTESVVRDGLPLCWWADSQSYKEQPFKMINLPKLKTHEVMVLTLAVKNLYGCISGIHKSHLHRLYPRTDDFTGVLLKLYKMIKPSLNIVDGILAMEGTGPAKKGIPKKLGIVVLGDDALYTDYVIAKLIGLSEELNPLIRKAKEEGLFSLNNLELISEVGDYLVRDFKFPQPFILNYMPRSILSFLKILFKVMPAIDCQKCKGCGLCEKICPKGAIHIERGKASIDYKKCIMCMCCGEMCRFGAVDIERSFLLKFLRKLHK